MSEQLAANAKTEKKKGNVVEEIQKLQQRREERRVKQQEMRVEKERREVETEKVGRIVDIDVQLMIERQR